MKRFNTWVLFCVILLGGHSYGESGLNWDTMPAMPVPVQEVYPTEHKGKIYVAGGLSDALGKDVQQMSDALQIYDPTKKRWRLGAALPEARHHAYLISVAHQLWLFGGFVYANGGRWSASDDVLLLDESTNRWRKVARLPKPLTETVALVLNGKVHLASGRSPSGPANAQWRDQADVNWHWQFDPLSRQVSELSPLPLAFNSAAGVVLEDTLYVVGGRQVGGGNLAQLWRYDVRANRWQGLADMPQAQGGLAAAVLDSNILVFGGEYFAGNGGVYATVWRYSSSANSWQRQGVMPVPRHGLGAVTADNSVFVIGGAAKVGLKATSARMEKVNWARHKR